MSVNELKEEWERLFASGAPNNSRSYLEIRIAYRIQELIPTASISDSVGIPKSVLI